MMEKIKKNKDKKNKKFMIPKPLKAYFSINKENFDEILLEKRKEYDDYCAEINMKKFEDQSYSFYSFLTDNDLIDEDLTKKKNMCL